ASAFATRSALGSSNETNTPGSPDCAPWMRNCSPKTVFPHPDVPQTNVGRPSGIPPNVSSSSPGEPELVLGIDVDVAHSLRISPPFARNHPAGTTRPRQKREVCENSVTVPPTKIVAQRGRSHACAKLRHPGTYEPDRVLPGNFREPTLDGHRAGSPVLRFSGS